MVKADGGGRRGRARNRERTCRGIRCGVLPLTVLFSIVLESSVYWQNELLTEPLFNHERPNSRRQLVKHARFSSRIATITGANDDRPTEVALEQLDEGRFEIFWERAEDFAAILGDEHVILDPHAA